MPFRLTKKKWQRSWRELDFSVPSSQFILSESPFRYSSGSGSVERNGYNNGYGNGYVSNSRESGNLNVADSSRATELLCEYNKHHFPSETRTLKNLCYCSYGAACDYEEICVKHEMAACFHAIRQVYATESDLLPSSAYGDSEEIEKPRNSGFMQSQHFYGCAPFERGTNASHLTCNSWRSVHGTPTSIACCYEGHLCNMNITLISHDHFRSFSLVRPLETDEYDGFSKSRGDLAAVALSLAVGCVLGSALLLVAFFVILLVLRRHERYVKKKLPLWLWNRLEATFGAHLTATSVKRNVPCDALLREEKYVGEGAMPVTLDTHDFDPTGSGSGSGVVTLNQRTIALDLTMMDMVARGRYGEVRKALYRGSVVAVKTFYTTEEESWKNERDIYQTQMLNHENILQYVAADISSCVESLTQMMLITDFHALGSLYDYLRERTHACMPCAMPSSTNRAAANQAFNLTDNCYCYRLDLTEALEIAFSIISGLEHLHNSLHGTGSRRKPEIAHRDLKSKNVIVKRPGVCCVADFGLAVRYENHVILPSQINVQVGTKRYMAPEVLSQTLNPANFDEFKAADMYSYALVVWEVLNVAQLNNFSIQNMSSGNDQHGFTRQLKEQEQSIKCIDANESRKVLISQQPHPHSPEKDQQRRVISRSSSSGIVTGASDRSTSQLLSTARRYYHRCAPMPGLETVAVVSPRREYGRLVGQMKENDSDEDEEIEEDTHKNDEHLEDCAVTVKRHPSAPIGHCNNSEKVYNGERNERAETINSPHCNEIEKMATTDTVVLHRLPYQDIIENDPSLAEMYRIICVANFRPKIDEKNDANPIVSRLRELLHECWSASAASRHTSLKVKKEIGALLAGHTMR